MQMKVGDLVELSSIGQRTLYLQGFRNKIGVVIEVRTKKEVYYPIKVKWFGAGIDTLLRSSLKFVSKA